MRTLTHVLLCGGSGTRLWPLSNVRRPKQLLKIFHDKSLMQLTAERNENFCSKIIAVCSEFIAAEVKAQLHEVSLTKNAIVIEEPVGRNTAAAIALAAFNAEYDDILLVTPSDHLINSYNIYADAISEAVTLAEDNAIVTFGLKPLYAETGFGYIQHSGNDVIRFAEKPSLPLAESFISSGDYLWNSGIFCFKAGIILTELRMYAPDIYEKVSIAAEELKNTGSVSIETMNAIPSNSIDYAVMERSARVKVVATNMEWSDVGSYESLSEALVNQYGHQNDAAVYINSDQGANIVIGNEKMVAMVGVEDLIVVNTPQALLVMKKGSGQNIKKLHQWVKENRPDLA
jgi:mannose-1-phosphate guanylyltransferase